MDLESNSKVEDTEDDISASGFDEPTVSAATADVSLLHHEKDVLVEKTKTQEAEILSLKLKVQAIERTNQELQLNTSDVFSHEEKVALEQEISVLRGKVALLERNNRVFSNEERTELKQELERTKRRFQRLNEQLASVRNSMEYDHINHVERALDNFVKKVKMLEKENNELRKMNICEQNGGKELSTQLIEEKEEIIKDQYVMIEELEHQIKAMKSKISDDQAIINNSLHPSCHDDCAGLANVESPSRRRSPARSVRSRLSSTRSRRRKSTENSQHSHSASDSPSSDSDARAVREMCNKMREDIGEAKKRLKDMGQDLDAPPYLSPTHVPRSHGWLVLDTARSAPAAKIRKDDGSSPQVLSARSAFEEDVSAMHILTQHSSPRGIISTYTDVISPGRKSSAAASEKLNSVPSIEIPSPLQSGRSPNTTVRLNSTWPIQKDMETNVRHSKKSVRVNEDDYRNSASFRPADSDFLRLLSRYEFLRIRALDHKFLEFQQECRHIAMLELLKLRHQAKIENSKLPVDSNPKQLPRRHGTDLSENDRGSSKLSSFLECDPRYPKPTKLSAVPPSYASYYALPENRNIRGATYRVYVAKKEYNPPDERKIEGKNVFSKIKLSVGDVATSLGAPHIRDDGKKYQLVHVNDRIGLVPFSFLQLAEDGYNSDPDQTLKKSSSLTNLGRITKMHKTLELRRKLMSEGA